MKYPKITREDCVKSLGWFKGNYYYWKFNFKLLTRVVESPRIGPGTEMWSLLKHSEIFIKLIDSNHFSHTEMSEIIASIIDSKTYSRTPESDLLRAYRAHGESLTPEEQALL